MPDSRALRLTVTSRRAAALGGLIALAAALEVAAAAGTSYIAGFHAVRQAVSRVDWPFLLLVVVSLAVSFVGYYTAYRGIFEAEGGPRLGKRQLRTVVAAGFGGFLTHGGSELDNFALQGAGADKRDAKTRVAALGGLEHGVLSIWGATAAICVLALGLASPPLDFSLPWAVLPLPGFVVAFWAADRYQHRIDEKGRLGSHLAVFLRSIHLLRQMFLQPKRYWSAIGGMLLFWAADWFAAWSALALFGYRMEIWSFVVGFATGMVFTRRTGPLAGAGVLMLVLPLTLWDSGAPLAVAVAGIFVYRVLSFVLPMPFSVASLPGVRTIGNERVPMAEGVAEPPSNEPALS